MLAANKEALQTVEMVNLDCQREIVCACLNDDSLRAQVKQGSVRLGWGRALREEYGACLSDDSLRAQVKQGSVRLGWRQALKLGQPMPGCLLPGFGVGNDIVQVEDHAECLIRAHVVPHAVSPFDLQHTT